MRRRQKLKIKQKSPSRVFGVYIQLADEKWSVTGRRLEKRRLSRRERPASCSLLFIVSLTVKNKIDI